MNVGKLNRTLFFLGFLGMCEKTISLPFSRLDPNPILNS